MSARIDHTVTSGTFSLDGGTWDVDNNVWVIGDDDLMVDGAIERVLAALAWEMGATLLTADRDFEALPEIATANWLDRLATQP